MPNSEGFRAMFEWNTCLGSIPNSKGFLLRVRLIDGRETTTIVDFTPGVGHHLRNVPINTVAAWRSENVPTPMDWRAFDAKYEGVI
ncbi:MAG: hypothetical protein ABFD89_17410 [Bryobacteraceae bacterium]